MFLLSKLPRPYFAIWIVVVFSSPSILAGRVTPWSSPAAPGAVFPEREFLAPEPTGSPISAVLQERWGVSKFRLDEAVEVTCDGVTWSSVTASPGRRLMWIVGEERVREEGRELYRTYWSACDFTTTVDIWDRYDLVGGGVRAMIFTQEFEQEQTGTNLSNVKMPSEKEKADGAEPGKRKHKPWDLPENRVSSVFPRVLVDHSGVDDDALGFLLMSGGWFESDDTGANFARLGRFPDFAEGVTKRERVHRDKSVVQDEVLGYGANGPQQRWEATSSHRRTGSILGSGGQDGTGPLVLFHPEEPVCLLSPLDEIMTLSFFPDRVERSPDRVGNSSQDRVSYGLAGSVTHVPANYSLKTVLLCTVLHDTRPENGAEQADADAFQISDLIEAWGEFLRSYHGKDRSHTFEEFASPITSQLSYSTANGAYYYYQTGSLAEASPYLPKHLKAPHRPDAGPKAANQATYEQALVGIKNYLTEELKLPVQAWLIDSWWYQKSVQGGIYRWEEAESYPANYDPVCEKSSAGFDLFPTLGMGGLAKQLRNTSTSTRGAGGESTPFAPIIAHSRMFASDNSYRTDYKFQVEDWTGYFIESLGEETRQQLALPLEDKFWADLFRNAVHEFGLRVYEQDWMWTQVSRGTCVIGDVIDCHVIGDVIIGDSKYYKTIVSGPVNSLFFRGQ